MHLYWKLYIWFCVCIWGPVYLYLKPNISICIRWPVHLYLKHLILNLYLVTSAFVCCQQIHSICPISPPPLTGRASSNKLEKQLYLYSILLFVDVFILPFFVFAFCVFYICICVCICICNCIRPISPPPLTSALQWSVKQQVRGAGSLYVTFCVLYF